MRFLKNFLILILFSCKNTVLIIDLNDPNLSTDNGVLFYKAKTFSGHLTEFYNTRKIKSEIQYLNGLKHGHEKYWYESGAEASFRWYSKSKKINEHIGYWGNGNLKFKYFFNQKGEHNGPANEWFNSGNIYKSFNYENGMESSLEVIGECNNRPFYFFFQKNLPFLIGGFLIFFSTGKTCLS